MSMCFRYPARRQKAGIHPKSGAAMKTAEDKSRSRSIAAYRANITRLKAKGDAYSAKVAAVEARLRRFMETGER
jgi:hypothetical protein